MCLQIENTLELAATEATGDIRVFLSIMISGQEHTGHITEDNF